MKTVQLGDELTFELNISDEVTIGELRKIQPLMEMVKDKKWDELIFEFIKLFSNDQNIVDRINNLSATHYTSLITQVGDILSQSLAVLSPEKEVSKKK